MSQLDDLYNHGIIGGKSLKDYTKDATALNSEILYGKTAYVNGNKLTGTIPSKAVQTYLPSTVNQVISAGQYLSAAQTILGDAELIASNIRNGINIFGVVGNLIDGAGLKKYASGTVGVSAGIASVSGLAFTPSVIVLEFYHSENGNIYREVYKSGYSEFLNRCYYTGGSSNPMSAPSVYYGGFQMYIPYSGGATCSWAAWE